MDFTNHLVFVSKYVWSPYPAFINQLHHEQVTDLAFDLVEEKFSVTKMNSGIKLRYFKNVRVDVECDMEFKNFPFDEQDCQFLIHSLSRQDLREETTL